jgi:hypothetical protein
MGAGPHHCGLRSRKNIMAEVHGGARLLIPLQPGSRE